LALDKVVVAPSFEEMADEEYEEQFGQDIFSGQGIFTGY
jgi:hypothetical protein